MIGQNGLWTLLSYYLQILQSLKQLKGHLSFKNSRSSSRNPLLILCSYQAHSEEVMSQLQMHPCFVLLNTFFYPPLYPSALKYLYHCHWEERTAGKERKESKMKPASIFVNHMWSFKPRAQAGTEMVNRNWVNWILHTEKKNNEKLQRNKIK